MFIIAQIFPASIIILNSNFQLIFVTLYCSTSIWLSSPNYFNITESFLSHRIDRLSVPPSHEPCAPQEC